ncbi:MAG: ABC transporter ATP-binding protein [Chloroflexi bacterium]|nr:ABC transporter ATP-binding protein [Chloroflexota bacterium]
MADIGLVRVTKHFGDVAAVDDLSLEIPSGEFLVVVGPSGCGKTTLLRLIAGLEEMDSGHIYLDGVWANETRVGKRNVQMIFQSLALWPHMKVLDPKHYSNVSLPLRVRQWTVDQINTRVKNVARRVGLGEDKFDRKPDELSGGERQRVALARAMTTAPGVFLMDEPLTSLDPPARVEMRKEILNLHKELGSTFVFVTHNMSDAFTMADRIAMMRDGRLVQVGTAEELWKNPADEFVREFLRSS